MSVTNSNERLMRFLQATTEQLVTIDRILDGKAAVPLPTAAGPLLLPMGAAAKWLGVSRATLWRMIRAGRLGKVEVLRDSFRVRRTDLEAIVAGNGGTNGN